MARIKFEDGTVVNFEGDPTQDDIEEVARQIYPNGSEPYKAKGGFGESVAPQGSLLRRLLPTKEEAPAAGGSALGGLLGKRLVPGVGLASLFSGGAEAMKQIFEHGQEKLGFPKVFKEKAPESSSEAAKRIGIASGVGGISEATGRLFGKLVAPFSSGTSPARSEAIDIAKREGINPSIRSRTDSLFPKGAEGFVERSAAGNVLTQQRQQALDDLGSYVVRVKDSISKAKTPEQFEATVKEALPAFRQKLKDTKDQLYEEVMPALQDKPVNTENSVTTIKTILKRRAGGKEGKALLTDWLDRLSPKGMQAAGYTEKKIPLFQNVKAIRTEVGSRGKFNDPAVSGIKADIDAIYAALSQDLDKAAGSVSEEVANKLGAANAANTTFMQEMKNEIFNKLLDTPPSQVHKILVKKEFPELITDAREILGDDAMQDVARKWFEDVINDSMSQSGMKKVIKPQTLLAKLDDYGSTVDALFASDPGKLKELERLKKVLAMMSDEQYKPRGWSGDILTKTAQQIIGLFASPVLRTEFGKELMTRGFPKVEFAVRRSVQPAVEVSGQKITNDTQPGRYKKLFEKYEK